MTRLTKTSNNLKKSAESERRAYAVLAAVLLGFLALAAVFRHWGWSWHDGALGSFQCPFEWLTHAPCPLCGGTRAFFLITEGRFVEAVVFAPGPAMLIYGAILVGLSALLPWRDGWPAFMSKLPAIALLLLLGVWPVVLLRTLGPG